MGISIRIVEMCAREKLGRPDAVAVVWTRLDINGDGIVGSRVEFVDPDPPVFKSGPRKGKPNWSKATNRACRIVSDAEVEAFAIEWSFRTGGCIPCTGTGERWLSWSAAEGNKTEPCPACGGSGTVPSPQANQVSDGGGS